MTAALEGGEWSAARPGRTLPPRKNRYPLYRSLGGPQGRSGGRKISPHRDSIPGPSRPQSVAIPTELPGPYIMKNYLPILKAHTSLMSYITNSMEHSLSYKLTVPQLVKKFSTFYGTRKFIRDRHSSLSSARLIHSMPSHHISFFNTHFNVILPSMSRFSKWSLSSIFPHQSPI